MGQGQILALYALIIVGFLFWLHATGKLPGIISVITHNTYSVTANGKVANSATNVSGNSLSSLSNAINSPTANTSNGGSVSGGLLTGGSPSSILDSVVKLAPTIFTGLG